MALTREVAFGYLHACHLRGGARTAFEMAGTRVLKASFEIAFLALDTKYAKALYSAPRQRRDAPEEGIDADLARKLPRLSGDH